MEDIFNIIEETVKEENQSVVVLDTTKPNSIDNESEDTIIIPLAYQIITTKDNQPTGKKDTIVDTYLCDRAKGIVPKEKAQKKADMMKKVFQKNTYFVLASYSVIRPNQKAFTKDEIIYQTK